MTNEPQRTSAGRRSKYSMEKKPVRVRRQIHMILEIFKLFEVANCKRTNSFFGNRMKQDNKLKGMNLETYKYFYRVAQWVFVSNSCRWLSTV